MWLLWRLFCISRIQIDDVIASTTCVKAKKEALVRHFKFAMKLVIDNATERHVRCIAALAMKLQVLVEEPNRLNILNCDL